MAHEAMIAGRNAALTAALDGTGWTEAAPLALALNPDGVRARSVAAGVEGAPVVIAGVFPVDETISFGGLYNTDLYQSDQTELALFSDAARTTAVWTSGRRTVIPPMLDPALLSWEDPRLWDGSLYPEDYLAWPATAYVFPPRVLARSFEWRVWSSGTLPSGAPAGYVEVDHLWLGDALFFDLQLDAEVTLDTGATSQRDAGRLRRTPGRAGRGATLPLDMIEPAMVDQLMTMVRRASGMRPLAWVPDRDDPALAFMYGFLGTAQKSSRRWAAGGWAASSLTLEELS